MFALTQDLIGTSRRWFWRLLVGVGPIWAASMWPFQFALVGIALTLIGCSAGRNRRGWDDGLLILLSWIGPAVTTVCVLFGFGRYGDNVSGGEQLVLSAAGAFLIASAWSYRHASVRFAEEVAAELDLADPADWPLDVVRCPAVASLIADGYEDRRTWAWTAAGTAVAWLIGGGTSGQGFHPLFWSLFGLVAVGLYASTRVGAANRLARQLDRYVDAYEVARLVGVTDDGQVNEIARCVRHGVLDGEQLIILDPIPPSVGSPVGMRDRLEKLVVEVRPDLEVDVTANWIVWRPVSDATKRSRDLAVATGEAPDLAPADTGGGNVELDGTWLSDPTAGEHWTADATGQVEPTAEHDLGDPPEPTIEFPPDPWDEAAR